MIQHNHLIVRAELDNCPDNSEWVHEWLLHMVDVLGMNVLAGPLVARESETIGNIGITGVVLLTTSHMAVHFWEEDGLMQLDIYTCGSLDRDVIFRELGPMEPSKIEFKYLDREHGLIEIH